MKVFCDLHIHSRFSRATSKDINIENLTRYAKVKGLNLLGTGDFTHPSWLSELKSSLVEDGSGILKTRDGFNFILQAEVSNIYSQDGKLRKIHNVILVPSFEVVEQVNEFLGKRGKLESDGRPIFGSMGCPELMENLMGISRDIVVIPAHIWTPWFSLFGSKSGFDNIEDCFEEYTKHIFALETGLSSDPAMNWRLSSLDGYSLVSNSDCHSFWPWRIGREANVLDLDILTYKNLFLAIRERDPRRFLYTIEVDPNYGKYHLDGHRNCNVCMEPRESLKNRNICPVCKRPLTIGVLHRVEELADREEGFVPKGAIPFKSLIPLSEIIANSIGSGQVFSKKVWEVYDKLIKEFGSEFEVLLNTPMESLVRIGGERVADGVIKVREGRVEIEPGFDGEYGRPVFGKGVSKRTVIENSQKSLSDFS